MHIDITLVFQAVVVITALRWEKIPNVIISVSTIERNFLQNDYLFEGSGQY